MTDEAVVDGEEERIEIDYDVVTKSSKEEWTDARCIKAARAAFHMPDDEELDPEVEAGLIKIARLDLYESKNRRYLRDVHNVSMEPVDAFQVYRMILDAHLPWTHPTRIAVELEYKEQLVRGVLQARKTVEELQGKPKLQIEGGKLLGPNGEVLAGG